MPLLLVVLAPLIILGAVASFMLVNAFETADGDRLAATARALSTAVDAQFNGNLTVLADLASSRSIQARDYARFQQRAQRVTNVVGGSVVLRSAPPESRVLAHTVQTQDESAPWPEPPEAPARLDNTLERLVIEDRAQVSDLLHDSQHDRYLFSLLTPMRHEGRLSHGLFLTLEPRSILQLLLGQDLGPGGFAVVLDGQQRVVAMTADPHGQLVGRAAPAWMTERLREPMAAQRGRMNGRGWTGDEQFFAFERLRLAPGWIVAVAQNAEAKRETVLRRLEWAAAVAAAILFGMIGLVVLTRRQAVLEFRRATAALEAGRRQVERLHAGLPAVLFLAHRTPGGMPHLLYASGDIPTVTGWPECTAWQRQEALAPWLAPDQAGFIALMEQALRDGHATMAWPAPQPKGPPRWLRLTLRALGQGEGDPSDVAGHVVNIQPEREAQAHATAIARLASLGEMAAGLAHELKQPLTVMSIAADNAQFDIEHERLDQARDRLELIATQAQRAGEVIEHLRSFAHGGERGGKSQPVSLDRVIEGMQVLLGGALRAEGVALALELPPEALVVLGHEIGLEQVLVNIVSNARDALLALPPGQPRRVTLQAVADPATRTVRLSVRDTGGGFPPDILARAFEPFLTTKGPDKGTGLGLAICHGLVRSMEGGIEVANDDQGAVVRITLPMVPPAA
jgi:C4-dicarboxylate-specific signal transduction histidine kinase